MKKLTSISALLCFFLIILLLVLVKGGSVSIFLGLPLAAICCSGMVLSLVNYSLLAAERSVKYTGVISVLLFLLFAVHYFNTSLYLVLWNYLIVAHLMLIGVGLYVWIPRRGVWRIASLTALTICVGGLSLAFLVKLTSPVFYSVFFYVLIVTSLVLFIGLIRQSDSRS